MDNHNNLIHNSIPFSTVQCMYMHTKKRYDIMKRTVQGDSLQQKVP